MRDIWWSSLAPQLLPGCYRVTLEITYIPTHFNQLTNLPLNHQIIARNYQITAWNREIVPQTPVIFDIFDHSDEET